jgi:hypothetical protein
LPSGVTPERPALRRSLAGLRFAAGATPASGLEAGRCRSAPRRHSAASARRDQRGPAPRAMMCRRRLID